ncbi:hypothetical protein Franean1_4808 [Parafrankia sp. EAN1pec]|nr:hypothetical protein Franean1_4808 [Frankia sp. EAN1pec]
MLATGVLLDLSVAEVWPKAITREHGRILERIGVNHVVYPERDAGERVAQRTELRASPPRSADPETARPLW